MAFGEKKTPKKTPNQNKRSRNALKTFYMGLESIPAGEINQDLDTELPYLDPKWTLNDSVGQFQNMACSLYKTSNHIGSHFTHLNPKVLER